MNDSYIREYNLLMGSHPLIVESFLKYASQVCHKCDSKYKKEGTTCPRCGAKYKEQKIKAEESGKDIRYRNIDIEDPDDAENGGTGSEYMGKNAAAKEIAARGLKAAGSALQGAGQVPIGTAAKISGGVGVLTVPTAIRLWLKGGQEKRAARLGNPSFRFLKPLSSRKPSDYIKRMKRKGGYRGRKHRKP